jgi:hypothetical protein
LQPEFARFGASLIYAMGPYLTAIAAAALVSFREAGPGFLWPGYLWLGAVVIAGSVAFGHWIGRWTRSPSFAAIAVAFVVLIANLYVGQRFGVELESGSPDVRVSIIPALMRSLPVLVLVFVAVFVPNVRSPDISLQPKGQSRLVQTGIAFAVVVALGSSLLAVSLSGPTVVPRKLSEPPMCTAGEIQICFWPEERKYFRFAQSMADRVTQLPKRILVIPNHYYEFGVRGRRIVDNDFYIKEGNMWSVADSIALHIGLATEPRYCETAGHATQARILHAEWQLETWLAARVFGGPRPANIHGGPPGVNIARVAAVARQPERQQTNWASDLLRSIRAQPCSSDS